MCAAVGASESEYEGTESEPDSEPETDSVGGSEQNPVEEPCLTGVTLHPGTGGMSMHDWLSLVV